MNQVGRPNFDLLAKLARQLAAEDDRSAVLTRVIDASITQIDGAEHAGITEITRDGVTTPVATSDVVLAVDTQQYTIGEGPCLDAAMEDESVVRVDDLRSDQRWPEFSEAAADLGIRSMLSFRLYTGAEDTDNTIGALNIYASAPNVFNDESVHTGTLLATHAAIAATAAATTSNLRLALQSRDTIGQAKGILMERFKLTSEQAFDLLIAASQHAHIKLNEIAEQLVTTGELKT